MRRQLADSFIFSLYMILVAEVKTIAYGAGLKCMPPVRQC